VGCPAARAQQFLDAVAHLCARRREQDEVVTYAFEIVHQMGRDHDGELAFGHCIGQRRQELAPRQRIQRRHTPR
jgi:hypothetical protein